MTPIPRTAARIGRAFMRALCGRWLGERLSSRGRLCGPRVSQETAYQASKTRHHDRAQEPAVVAGEALVVFREAHVDQRRWRKIDIGNRLAAGQSEVVVLRRRVMARTNAAGQPDALVDQEYPDGKDLGPEPRPTPPRQVAAMPRDPIDEEQDVARLLLHDGFERLDELGREEARCLRHRKQPKREEAVDALAEPGHHERPFRIARATVLGLGREPYPIGFH